MSKEKDTGLRAVINQLNKRYGDGTIMSLESDHVIDVPVIPTGILSLDIAMGIGGFPRGRIVELYGPESSGKSTLALLAVVEAQRQGLNVGYIDAEHAMDLKYAKALGVDIKGMLFSQPDSGEEALEIVHGFTGTGEVGLIVVDSVSALTPRAELEGEMGDAVMGAQARMMSQAMRKLTAVTSNTNTTIIFINQIRHKIGVMFGSPETTSGGNALKFAASMRLDIRRKEPIKDGDKVIGAKTKVTLKKNKFAAPYTEAMFDLVYGKGVCKHGLVLDLGTDHGIVDKNGASYAFKGTKIGFGRDKAIETLKADEDLYSKISKAIERKLKEVVVDTVNPIE